MQIAGKNSRDDDKIHPNAGKNTRTIASKNTRTIAVKNTQQLHT